MMRGAHRASGLPPARVALALALLVAIPLVGGQAVAPSHDWTQPGGDARRSGVATFRPLVFDVLGAYAIEGFGEPFDRSETMGLVPTPYGIAGLGREASAGECWVFFLEPRSGQTITGAREPCAAGGRNDRLPGILAYVPSSDAILLSLPGGRDAPVLRLRDAATGADVWGVRPADVGASSLDANDGDWAVKAAAVDESSRAVVVGIQGPGPLPRRALLAELDLDTGALRWARPLEPFVALAKSAGTDVALPYGLVEESGRGFVPESVTLTQRGIVVVGFSSTFVQASGAVQWFDRDGVLVGGREAQMTQPILREQDVEAGSPDYYERSRHAAASGHVAALALGSRALLVDPIASEPARDVDTGLRASGAAIATWAAPAWWLDTLVLPVRRELRGYDARSLQERWSWSDSVSATLADVVLVPPGDALVLVARNTTIAGDAPEVALARVRLADGSTAQRIPLPIAPDTGPSILDDSALRERPRTGAWPGHILPLPEQDLLLVWADQGDLVVMGEAPPSLIPALSLSDAYPPPGSPVTLEATAPGATSFVVAWGDGTLETLSPGATGLHQFADAGALVTLVTAILEDGRTATARQVVHVGGTPPRELTALQEALDPGNYDLTFGILGILVALAGGLLALVVQRRRRSRLARELGALESAFAATKDQPLACEAALAERKAHARGLLLDHKIDEAQFAVLDRRVAELAAELRLVAIDDRFPFLPVGIARLLRDVLADGRVSALEREHFLAALERDGILSSEQKAKVRAMIDEWFARDAGRPEVRA